MSEKMISEVVFMLQEAKRIYIQNKATNTYVCVCRIVISWFQISTKCSSDFGNICFRLMEVHTLLDQFEEAQQEGLMAHRIALDVYGQSSKRAVQVTFRHPSSHNPLSSIFCFA